MSDINSANCKIVCVILFKPEYKKFIKGILDKEGVPSQFVTTKKLGGPKGAPLSVMSNILKQMNAKLKLDLYRLNVPQFKNSMVIGIDLVMNGSSKLIGCCATSNKNLTQCFTKMYKQKLPEMS
jgi:aubergine